MIGKKNGLACDATGETYRVLFTFQLGKHTYAVVEEKNWLLGVGCYKLKWNAIYGTQLALEREEGEIAALADRLLERATEKEGGLQGEHYLVSYREDGRLKTAKTKTSPLFCRGARIAPFFFKGGLQLLFAALITLFCIHTRLIFPGCYAIFPALERGEMVSLCWALGLATPLLCYLICLKESGIFSLFAFAMIPHGALLLFSAMKGSAVLFWIITGIALLFLLLWVIPQLIRMFKTENRDARKNLFSLVRATAYSLFGGCVLFSMIFSSVFDVTVGVVRPQIEPSEEETQVLASYETAASCLDEQVWQTLLLTERLNVLQRICDYECQLVLGCPTVQVRAADCEKNVQGSYNALTNTATIDLEHLMNDEVGEVVDTILHESRHAWQHAMVRMYEEVREELGEEHLKLSVFRLAQRFEYEFDAYRQPDDGFDEYYRQLVETDCRDFAKQRMEEAYKGLIGCEEEKPEKTDGNDR